MTCVEAPTSAARARTRKASGPDSSTAWVASSIRRSRCPSKEPPDEGDEGRRLALVCISITMLQRRSDSSRDFDVIIVGARCAGAPLATLLARRGLDVCLVDRDGFPSDTPSTHGIQPVGVQVLDRLGVLDRLRELAPPIEAGFLAFDDYRVSVDDTAGIVGAPMFNLRRVTLDAVLVDAARESGAELRAKTAVTGLLKSRGRVVGVET